MAGEAVVASPSSWTLRSKIWLEAGETGRGEELWCGRPDDGGIVDWGAIVVPSVGDRIGGAGAVIFDGGGFVVSIFLSFGSSFFLPRFQNLRLPVFESCSPFSSTSSFGLAVLVGCVAFGTVVSEKPSPRRGTFEVREPGS